MKKMRDAFQTHKKEKITAILFLIVIFGMLIGMITTTEDLGEGFLLAYRTNVPTGAPYLVRIEGAIDAAENAVNEGAYHRQEYVELYGLSQLLMGKNIITDYNYGALYKTNYNQITFAVSDRFVPDSYMATYELVNRLQQDDIDFLYIQLPFKIPPEQYGGALQLPENVHDHANENADTFVWGLEVAGVDTYDVRDDFWSS